MSHSPQIQCREFQVGQGDLEVREYWVLKHTKIIQHWLLFKFLKNILKARRIYTYFFLTWSVGSWQWWWPWRARGSRRPWVSWTTIITNPGWSWWALRSRGTSDWVSFRSLENMTLMRPSIWRVGKYSIQVVSRNSHQSLQEVLGFLVVPVPLQNEGHKIHLLALLSLL